MDITGRSLPGFRAAGPGSGTFAARNPATGEELPGSFAIATPDEVAAAADLAAKAFLEYSRLSGPLRCEFLRAIAAGLEREADVIVPRACAETALPELRVRGELARTCLQLRLFAGLIEEGSWVDARIDHRDPDRVPLPKPDVRSMLRPLGPVVVFGAANFPLAYSTAGGDTASALAAGCPVIVKAHPSHPGTCDLVGQVIVQAAKDQGMPEGVFSQIFDSGHDAGAALVRHPGIAAVGFTGSRRGGRALMDLAAARPEPIPVYAEMSSVNPVYLLPGALAERGVAIAEGLAASVTLGCGQFCTNPGIVIFESGSDTSAFRQVLQQRIAAAAPATMLSADIAANYQRTRSQLADHPGVKEIVRVPAEGTAGGAALYETTAAEVLRDPSALTAEVFGPSTLLVVADGPDEVRALAETIEGQLTSTVHAADADLDRHRELLAILERRAGRLIYNGYPTGLEVCPAIVHGGPYPATSDGRSTAVGTGAILRFVRPVCWQDHPDHLLPPELQEANPLGIVRTVDGKLQAVSR